MGYDDMSYHKCKYCKYCEERNALSGGVVLTCLITKKQLWLKHCKHYYGTGESQQELKNSYKHAKED